MTHTTQFKALPVLAVATSLAVASVPTFVLAQDAGASMVPDGALQLLTPENSVLMMIDHQPQMAFGVQSIQHQELLNNVVGLTKAARAFDIPTIFTTITPDTFSGPFLDDIREIMPDNVPIARTSMNAWDNDEVRAAVEETGRPKIVMAALWTEVCLNFPVLSALEGGYEVYIVTDASGGSTVEAHDMAVDRMIQAGAIPVTWQQTMLEWQRDWANEETYAAVTEIIVEHSGAYGIGIEYADWTGIMGEGDQGL